MSYKNHDEWKVCMTELEWIDVFGDNLADIIKYAHMTQRELADAAGISESMISDYIHKRRLPGIKAIINITHALNCSIDDLVDFEEMIE